MSPLSNLWSMGSVGVANHCAGPSRIADCRWQSHGLPFKYTVCSSHSALKSSTSHHGPLTPGPVHGGMLEGGREISQSRHSRTKSSARTIRIYNCQQLATASGAVLKAVNGCATHNSGQMLTFQGKIGPDSKAFTMFP